MKPVRPHLPHALLIGSALSLGLAACGGGGGGSGSSTTSTPLVLSGNASNGAALAGATVEAKCATGSGSATTDTSGHYRISIDGGALPCVLRAPNGSTALHSVAEAGGSQSLTANLTPLSEALVASLASAPPADLYATFDSSAQGRITAGNISGARANLTAALAGVTDISALDPLKDDLSAAPAATNAALGKLATALTDARLSQADLDAALAAAGGITAPVKTLLQAASATCSGLRSGSYRLIAPFVGTGGTQRITIDAKNLSVSYADANTDTLVDQGGCQFSTPDNDQFYVSASGVTLLRYSAGSGKTGIALIIPEQTLPISAFAGTWNEIGFGRDASNTPLEGWSAQSILDSAGNFTGNLDCGSELGVTCTNDTLPTQLKTNSNGGFDTTYQGSAVRMFAFRTASGGTMMVTTSPDGSALSFLAKVGSLTLPTVGSVTRYWNMSFNSAGYQGNFISETTTITASNAAANTYTRSHASDGHQETLTINQPKDGMRYRPAATATNGSGGTVNVSAAVLMRIGDTGFGVARNVTSGQNFFAMSIDRP
ncbi:MAG: hypothetical protein J0L85_04405 [Zoogloea sp.]|nr:hypothetical protein [Zoogloea sp.]MCA0185591.1 hypothetical protein [Pseudomonadota bacterium]